MNIPTFAIVDTNSDPTSVDYAIPANDDAAKSIDKILQVVTEAVAEGLTERQGERDKNKAAAEKANAAEEKEEKAEAAPEKKATKAASSTTKKAPRKRTSEASSETK